MRFIGINCITTFFAVPGKIICRFYVNQKREKLLDDVSFLSYTFFKKNKEKRGDFHGR